MPFPSLAKIATMLSEADIQRLLVLKKAGPKLAKLEAKRDAIAGKLADVERQLRELTGDVAPKPPAKPGRKPGRNPGRKPGACAAGRPQAVKPAKAVKAKKPAGRPAAKRAVRTPAEQAAINARMAKARAARTAKAAEARA